MPLVKRVITCPSSYVDYEISERTTDSISSRQNANFTNIIGAFNQIAFLSTYSLELLNNLFLLVEDMNDRVMDSTNRTIKLISLISDCENRVLSLDIGKGHKGINTKLKYLKNRYTFLPTILNKSTNNSAILESYENSQHPPQLWKFESIVNIDCMRNFSNPAYFFQEWLKNEQVKQEKLIKENEETKILRKQMKLERRNKRREDMEKGDEGHRNKLRMTVINKKIEREMRNTITTDYSSNVEEIETRVTNEENGEFEKNNVKLESTQIESDNQAATADYDETHIFNINEEISMQEISVNEVPSAGRNIRRKARAVVLSPSNTLSTTEVSLDTLKPLNVIDDGIQTMGLSNKDDVQVHLSTNSSKMMHLFKQVDSFEENKSIKSHNKQSNNDLQNMIHEKSNRDLKSITSYNSSNSLIDESMSFLEFSALKKRPAVSRQVPSIKEVQDDSDFNSFKGTAFENILKNKPERRSKRIGNKKKLLVHDRLTATSGEELANKLQLHSDISNTIPGTSLIQCEDNGLPLAVKKSNSLSLSRSIHFNPGLEWLGSEEIVEEGQTLTRLSLLLAAVTGREEDSWSLDQNSLSAISARSPPPPPAPPRPPPRAPAPPPAPKPNFLSSINSGALAPLKKVSADASAPVTKNQNGAVARILALRKDISGDVSDDSDSGDSEGSDWLI